MTEPSKTERLFFAFDFDGTIVKHEFPKIGRRNDTVFNFMRWLRDKGHCIIIWTCRSGVYLKEMLDYLDRANIPYDYVNDNPECPFTNDPELPSPKIFAHYYIDDRAINIADVKGMFQDMRRRASGLY